MRIVCLKQSNEKSRQEISQTGSKNNRKTIKLMIIYFIGRCLWLKFQHFLQRGETAADRAEKSDLKEILINAVNMFNEMTMLNKDHDISLVC